MTRQNSAVESLPSHKGLITEANPLNFPEGATLDERNFEIDNRGIRRKRPGLQFTNTAVTLGSDEDLFFFEQNIKTLVWENAGGQAGKRIFVVHGGGNIRFFDITTIVDGNLYQNPVGVHSFSSKKPSMSIVSGNLIVVGADKGSTWYQMVSIFTWSNGVVSRSNRRLLVRDIWGVNSGAFFLDPDNLPQTLPYRSSRTPDYIDMRPVGGNNQQHQYNLRNQGWAKPVKDPNSETKRDPLDLARSESENIEGTDVSYLPALSESIDIAMHPNPSNSTDPVGDRFWSKTWFTSRTKKMEPARGGFIIDFFNRGQSRAVAYKQARALGAINQWGPSDIEPHLPQDITDAPIGCCASFAGRAWYGGFLGPTTSGDSYSPNTSSTILFSRVGSSTLELAYCYQVNDPTDIEFPDILDTDGGSIEITGANDIVAMKEYLGKLLVFARNGVWAVFGGSEYGFSATNYRVDKVSDYGIVGEDSIIETGDMLMYWSQEGIMSIGINEGGQIIIQNMTENTIQRFYDEIEMSEKELAKGVHDPTTKTVRWLYNISYDMHQEDRDNYSMELVFNYRIGAFTVNNYSARHETRISSVITLGRETHIGSGTSLYYIISRRPGNVINIVMQQAQTLKGSFRDFGFFMPPAYLITGYLATGDNQRVKQIPYLTTHFVRTETLFNPGEGLGGISYDFENESSCKIQARWEWSNSPNSNRWGPEFQAYRYTRLRWPEMIGSEHDTGFETIVTKNKIRGKGRTVSFLFRADDDKDCQILGWSFIIGVNGNV